MSDIDEPVGESQFQWRAVDHEGEIIESYATKTRDKIGTNGLHPMARPWMTCTIHKQEIGRWANNRVENSHLPFRRRVRAMLRFRQMRSLQKFASVHANCHHHFTLERHLIDRRTYKERRSAALAEWQFLAS